MQIKNAMKYFTLLFYLLLTSNIHAQEWSFGGEIGATYSFFDYTPIYEDTGFFDRGRGMNHNEGWTLTYYSKKRYFFLIGVTRFFPRQTDVYVLYDTGRARGKANGTFNRTICLNLGTQLNIFGSEKFFFEPFTGIGLEILERYNTNSSINLGNAILVRTAASYETGINPTLQAGFRFAFQHRRSKFSLKALGNLGLNYYAHHEYDVILPENTYQTSVRGKSDFLAAQVSYEYIFKSEKWKQEKIERKARKRKKKR